MILGMVLVIILVFFTGRFFDRRFWLPGSENYHKCKYCGKYYKDHPYYFPHCGGVVDECKDD